MVIENMDSEKELKDFVISTLFNENNFGYDMDGYFYKTKSYVIRVDTSLGFINKISITTLRKNIKDRSRIVTYNFTFYSFKLYRHIKNGFYQYNTVCENNTINYIINHVKDNGE